MSTLTARIAELKRENAALLRRIVSLEKALRGRGRVEDALAGNARGDTQCAGSVELPILSVTWVKDKARSRPLEVVMARGDSGMGLSFEAGGCRAFMCGNDAQDDGEYCTAHATIAGRWPMDEDGLPVRATGSASPPGDSGMGLGIEEPDEGE